jgi:AraC-like DNA-binding protein
LIMKKKTIFYKYFIILSLLVAIPTIIVSAILCYQVARYSENEIGKSLISKLKVAANFTKTISQGLYMDALKLNTNGTVNSIALISSYDDIMGTPEGMDAVYNLQKSLNSLASANDILHSVYLYSESAGYILTSNMGPFPISEFNDKGWMDKYREFSEFKAGSAWLTTRRLSNAEGKGTDAYYNVITFFYKFDPYTTIANGTLIFNIYEETLQNMINSNSSIDEGYIAIIDRDGNVVSHIQESLVGKKLEAAYIDKVLGSGDESTAKEDGGDKGEGFIIDNDSDVRQLVTYYRSDFNGWIYIGVFPLDKLTEKVNSLMVHTVYIGLALLLAGVIVAWFISRKISTPLSKLVEDFRVRKGIDIKSNDSDMSILSNAFDYMLKEEDRLFSILENNRVNNKNASLMNLLQGKSNEEWIYDLTGVDFIYNRFICAIVLIDKYKDFTNTYTSEQRDYMRTLILKVSEQLIGTTYKCAGMVYEKQKIALLINFDTIGFEEVGKCLKDIFIKIQAELSKVFDNTVSVGIGNVQESCAGVTESFDKAQDALKYKLISGFGSINFWEEIRQEDTEYYYPYELENQIFNLINSGNTERMEETVSGLIRDIRENAGKQYENVIQIFNQMAVNTVKYLFDMHLNTNMIFGNNIYHILSSKETLEDIKEWLIETFTLISDYLETARYQDKGYFDRALEYINENYKRDIDINLIAEYVGLSYSHLRKIFKDQTDDNIINYINNKRINESKRLLYQTNMTTREIALNLGYNNEQSFVRFFKKYESISPAEFRLSRRSLDLDYINTKASN